MLKRSFHVNHFGPFQPLKKGASEKLTNEKTHLSFQFCTQAVATNLCIQVWIRSAAFCTAPGCSLWMDGHLRGDLAHDLSGRVFQSVLQVVFEVAEELPRSSLHHVQQPSSVIGIHVCGRSTFSHNSDSSSSSHTHKHTHTKCHPSFFYSCFFCTHGVWWKLFLHWCAS